MSVTPADLRRFEALVGNAGRALSRLIRPAIMPKAETAILIVADYSQIEARVLPWLANSEGAEDKLDIFREVDEDPSAPDVYKRAAAATYDKDPEDVTKGERQEGKVQELSLGFGGGKGALMAMAALYRMSLTPAKAQELVDRWRATNRWAVAFWDELWTAFMRAYHQPGSVHSAGRVAYTFDDGYLGGTMFCALPDGRLLSYPFLRYSDVEKTDRYGEVTRKTVLTYLSQGRRKTLWAGILAENITQAAAASILRAKIVEVERELPGLLIGHTHDELIGEAERDGAEGTAEKMKALMERHLDWTGGLPIRADVDVMDYYTKCGD